MAGSNICQRLYSQFLFAKFIEEFNRFFSLRKNDLLYTARAAGFIKAKISHCFWSWQDAEYTNFMIDVLQCLEPIFFKARETISRELDEVNQVIFIKRGKYSIGYKINTTEKFLLHFGSRTVIGAFEQCFKKRSIFIYRTRTEVFG